LQSKDIIKIQQTKKHCVATFNKRNIIQLKYGQENRKQKNEEENPEFLQCGKRKICKTKLRDTTTKESKKSKTTDTKPQFILLTQKL